MLPDVEINALHPFVVASFIGCAVATRNVVVWEGQSPNSTLLGRGGGGRRRWRRRKVDSALELKDGKTRGGLKELRKW